ncbi:MAG: hypothetical protein AB7V77_00945 [Candidatus Woesearchaeota archaeon]
MKNVRQKKLLVIDSNKNYCPLMEYSDEKMQVIYCNCSDEGISQILTEDIDGIVLNLDSMPFEGARSAYNFAIKTGFFKEKTLIFMKSYDSTYLSKLQEDILKMAEFNELKHLKEKVKTHSKFEGIVPLVNKIYESFNIL